MVGVRYRIGLVLWVFNYDEEAISGGGECRSCG